MGRGITAVGVFCGLLATPGLAQSQNISESEPAARGGRAATPELQATKLQGPLPVLDGLLDEADWDRAAPAETFTQFEPNEGASASQRTVARVLYGEEALYVGIRAFDSAPDSIVSQLARRDERPHSDWLDVVIDSYHDRRTAFRFGVNPVGVKVDTYHFDDTNEDDSWDAVWDVATQRDAEGWTAEFRIPYSQLRFGSGDHQTWGINFVREVARHQETSLWAPLSRGDGAIVSRFG
ncbi:MAG: carbohydrate binding family 9 domain-containing protein, partial [Longimicrobiales bacterium]